jgi:hypothetical protein
MAIKRDKNDLEFQKFKEATTVSGQPGVVVVNPDGSPIGNAAGGTQYTEAATDSTITGTAIMWEDTSDTLRAVSAAKPLPVSATIDTTGLATNATDTSVASIDTKTPALGQALAAASTPVVLTAAQITTLTPPAAITGYSTSAKQDTIIGHVDGIEGLLTTIDTDTSNISTKIDTIAGDTTSIQTAVELIDDTVATTASAIPSKGLAVSGTDGTNARVLKTDTSGELQVDVVSSELPTGAALDSTLTTINGTVGDVVTNTAAIAAPVNTIGTTDVFNVAVFNGADGQITDFATQTTLAAINTKLASGTVIGDVNLGATDNAVLDTIDAVLDTINAKLVTGTDIGDVTINNSTGAAAVNIQDGGNTITVDGTVAVTNSDITSIKTAVELLDNSVDGNYLNVNLNLTGTDVSSTNAVPTKGIPSDIDINGSNANHAQKYYTNAGAVTDGIVWSPAAGKRWHILYMKINVSAACTVTLEDDLAAGDSVIDKNEFAANSGITYVFDKEHPWCSGEDAADLLITTTAGNVYVLCVGYEV